MNAKAQKIVKIAGYSLMAVILVVAIVYVNFIYEAPDVEGYEIGERCPEFELSAYKTAGNPNGEAFSSDSAKGQVLVINFWYKTCSSCEAELPHFNEVQGEYADDVKIIVVHAPGFGTQESKQQYIDEHGYNDYQMTFLQDTEELYLFKKLGGKGAYPITVILDREGIIRSVNLKSMTKEELTEEIQKWL